RDIIASRELKKRVAEVRQLRSKSKRKATLKAALTPTRFGEDRQPSVDYLGIPQTFSENRRYITAGRLGKDVIASIKLFTAEDPDGLLFGIVSSSMFLAWQKAIGGRLEMRISFANTLTWNTFPMPELTAKSRSEIIECGKAVLEARAKFPNRSLADHYQPLAMDPDLLKAHDKLDKAVDKACGAPRKLTNEKQRQELLFQNYVKLTQ